MILKFCQQVCFYMRLQLFRKPLGSVRFRVKEPPESGGSPAILQSYDSYNYFTMLRNSLRTSMQGIKGVRWNSNSSNPTVAVLFQAIEPPVINGVRKPRKPGGKSHISPDYPTLVLIYFYRISRLRRRYCIYIARQGNRGYYATCLPFYCPT